MSDVFISHSSKDAELANYICDQLEQRGLTCWITPRNVIPGQDWAASISSAILNSKVLLLIYSENSSSSTQVPRELGLADKNNKFIMPYKIDDTELSGTFDYYLTSCHWITANPAKGDYKIDEMYAIISGVVEASKQGTVNNTFIDNLTIHNHAPVTHSPEDMMFRAGTSFTAGNNFSDIGKSFGGAPNAAAAKKSGKKPVLFAAIAVAIVLIITIVVLFATGVFGGNQRVMQPETPPGTVVKDEKPGTYTVRLKVSCQRNDYMNQYDVDILVNGSKIDTLLHGTSNEYDLRFVEGAHKIEFRLNGRTVGGNDLYDRTDSGTYCIKTINVSRNMEVGFEIMIDYGNTIKVTSF